MELTTTPHRRRATWWRRACRSVGRSIAATLALMFVLLLVPTALGLDHRVTSGSLAFEEMASARDVRSGDLVTFAVPGSDHLVTRRIVSISAGVAVTRTADRRVDPWRVDLDQTTVLRVVLRVPLVGHLLTPDLLPLVVGVGVVLALLLLVDLVRLRARARSGRRAV